MKPRGFVMLWSAILDSSVWDTAAETRLTWITMLLLKDIEGMVRGTVESLARRANLDVGKVAEAITILEGPDPSSNSKVEEGRRIRKVDGGWFIINHEAYRFSTEAKREFWKEQKRKQRSETGGSRNGRKTRKQVEAEGQGRERRFENAVKRGDEKAADGIAAEGVAGRTFKPVKVPTATEGQDDGLDRPF